jgi:hypothetical protein
MTEELMLEKMKAIVSKFSDETESIELIMKKQLNTTTNPSANHH